MEGPKVSASQCRHLSLVAALLLSVGAACSSSDPFESGTDRPLAFEKTTTTMSGDLSEDVAAPLESVSDEPDPATDSTGSLTATASVATTPTITTPGSTGGGSSTGAGGEDGSSPLTARPASGIDVDDASVSDPCGSEQNEAGGASPDLAGAPCFPMNSELPTSK